MTLIRIAVAALAIGGDFVIQTLDQTQIGSVETVRQSRQPIHRAVSGASRWYRTYNRAALPNDARRHGAQDDRPPPPAPSYPRSGGRTDHLPTRVRGGNPPQAMGRPPTGRETGLNLNHRLAVDETTTALALALIADAAARITA